MECIDLQMVLTPCTQEERLNFLSMQQISVINYDVSLSRGHCPIPRDPRLMYAVSILCYKQEFIFYSLKKMHFLIQKK